MPETFELLEDCGLGPAFSITGPQRGRARMRRLKRQKGTIDGGGKFLSVNLMVNVLFDLGSVGRNRSEFNRIAANTVRLNEFLKAALETNELALWSLKMCNEKVDSALKTRESSWPGNVTRVLSANSTVGIDFAKSNHHDQSKSGEIGVLLKFRGL